MKSSIIFRQYGGVLVSTGIVGGMVSEPRTLAALKRGTLKLTDNNQYAFAA